MTTALVGLAWVPIWLAVTHHRDARAILGPRTAATTNASTESFLTTLTDPAVFRAAVLIIASAPAVGFGLNWSSSLLHDTYGIEQADVGRYMVLPPIAFDAGSIAFGFLASTNLGRARKGDPPRFLIAVAALLALTLAGAAAARNPWLAIAAMSVALFGSGALFAVLTADMLARIPAARISAASGMAAAAQSLAYLIANPLIGRVRDRTGGYGWQMLALAALVVPGALIWIAWKPSPVVSGEHD